MDYREIWARVQTVLACVGGVIGGFLGGVDGMLITLMVLMAIDYVTGVMIAVLRKELSSSIGFKGLFKKVLILCLVGVANVLDVHVLGGSGAIRGMVICFYISNEGVSVLENATAIGLPVPGKLKDVLVQIHSKSGESTDTEKTESAEREEDSEEDQ